MWNKLDETLKRYLELDELLAQPEVISDPKRLQSLAKERAGIEKLATDYKDYLGKSKSLEETRAMLREKLDEGMSDLVKEEISQLENDLNKLQEQLKQGFLSKDPNDEKDIIIEIRAGTGGEEAALFAADLYRMYSRYAQSKGWAVEMIDCSEITIGGFKEVIFEVKGKGVYSRFKYERGVHRVQRVPTTEASGRIHTSTATVAVLPQADEVEVNISPDDLRIDIFHSGSAGGQNVNKVATAVRITHVPTGIVAVCQDERSQLKNKQKALAVLRARLLDAEIRRQEEQITSDRRSQVGTGERAEKIRTYNFPQDRVTDHRVGVTLHNLPKILSGDIDALINSLATSEEVAVEA